MLFLSNIIFITLFKNGKDSHPVVLLSDLHPKMLTSSSSVFTWAFSATICHLSLGQLLSKCHSKPVLLKETMKIYCFKSKLRENSKVKDEEQGVGHFSGDILTLQKPKEMCPLQWKALVHIKLMFPNDNWTKLLSVEMFITNLIYLIWFI